MATNFHLTLPLLESLDDAAVAEWGRAFDWSIPEFDVYVYPGGEHAGPRKIVQSLQPARALLIHGSDRLKDLLLRPDMFGTGSPYAHEGGDWGSPSRPLNSAHDFWSDLWAAAWALGDARTVDRLWTWVPDGVKNLAVFQGRAHFLTDMGRHGKPQDLPAMLLRVQNLIREDPMHTLGLRGREKSRLRQGLVRCMTQATSAALKQGNLRWAEAVALALPEVARQPQALAEAFDNGHFALGRRWFEALPVPPGMTSPSEGGFERWGSERTMSWLERLVQGWERCVWLKRDTNERPDEEGTIEMAQWLVHGLGQDETGKRAMRDALHKAAGRHVTQWGARWIDFLISEGAVACVADIERMAKDNAPDDTATRWLRTTANPQDWSEALMRCRAGNGTPAAAVQRAARWGGRFSNGGFPEGVMEGEDALRLLWVEGRAETLGTELPDGPRRPAVRL